MINNVHETILFIYCERLFSVFVETKNLLLHLREPF